jgi:hypothetical protein
MRSVPHCEQIRDQQQVLEAVEEYDRVPEPFGIREFHRPRDIGQVADDLPVDLPPLWTNLDGAISLDRYAETVPPQAPRRTAYVEAGRLKCASIFRQPSSDCRREKRLARRCCVR